MGIDVYNRTGKIDWARVRAAGHLFGIVKATEGIHMIDVRLNENLAALADADMVRGVYHFFHAALDPELQADHFLNAIKNAGYDVAKEMPVVLDLEDRAGTTQVGVATMCTHVSIWLD